MPQAFSTMTSRDCGWTAIRVRPVDVTTAAPGPAGLPRAAERDFPFDPCTHIPMPYGPAGASVPC